MILGICDSPEVLSVVNIIIIVVKIIRIVVPIILMLSVMIGLTKAIINNDNDALNKALKNSVRKVIAAVLVFLIPTFVNVIASIAGSTGYKECVDFTNTIDIRGVYTKRTNELIEVYKDSENENDYRSAKNYINMIKYQDVRNNALTELEEAHDEINGKNNVSGVIDGSCFAEYENGNGLATIYLNGSKVSGTSYKFINGGRVVLEGNSKTYKSENTNELLVHPGMEIKLDNGKTKKVECEVKHTKTLEYNKDGYYFRKNSSKDKTSSVDNPYPDNGISYYVYVPKDFNNGEKYPLVLALHGGFGWGSSCNGSTTSEANQTNHFLKTALYYNKYPINKVSSPDVNAVVIAPSNMTCNWEPSIPKALDIMHAYIKMFNIDVDRVIVTGTSQGGYGTMDSGFLEEQILYKATDNDTTLESVASMYNTTVEEIKKYNSALKMTINYSDKAQTKLKSGSLTIIKPKSDENQRSIFSLLVPMSPAKNSTRCAFTPSTIYDTNKDCKQTPPYTLKTPIWVITSNDEYPNIQQFAKELTAYYEKNGDIRYTVLSNIKKHYKVDAHDTQIPVLGYTRAFDWMISQSYGSIQTKNNMELDAIEKELGQAFVKDFHP